MDALNTKTKEAIASLADAGITISMTHAAQILGLSNPRKLQVMAERGELPFAAEITLPGETKRRFRIYTTRFIKYLCGELDDKIMRF